MRRKAQGLGVGGRLLRLAEEQALARGLREVRLYTNEAMTENLAYYLRRGYSETHRARQDGFRPIFFTKPLELVTELDLVPVEDRLLGRREARNDRPSARGAGGGAEVREVQREGWSPTQQREGRRWWLDRNSAQDRVARYVQDDAGDPR